MKSFKVWLLSISLLSIFILYGSSIGVSPIVSNLFVFLSLTYPFFKYSLFKGIKIRFLSSYFILILSLILIIINIIFSIDFFTTLQYWLIYLMLLCGLGSWIKYFKVKGEFKLLVSYLSENLSIYFLVNLIIIYLGLMIGLGNAKTYNSFGIIAGSALLYTWYVPSKNKRKKILTIVLLLYFILLSQSRSSLIFAAISIFVIEFFIIRKNYKNKLYLLGLFLIISGLFGGKLLSWFSEKQTVNQTKINSLSDLTNLNNDRIDLVNHFFAVYTDNLFSGYGANTVYQDLREWDSVDNIGVHNGILEMVLTIGLPLSIIFLFYFFNAFLKLKRISINHHQYLSLFAFSLYCLFRSYGESYFLLNIGNQMSIFFIVFLCVGYNIKLEKDD